MLATDTTPINVTETRSFTIARVIGDLPCHLNDIDISTPVEKIMGNLKERTELPGVVLRENGNFVGVLSRIKIFEWLGRPYGVELFYKRSIKHLYTSLNVTSEFYPRNLPINDAVRKSLNRPAEIRYEPLVVSFGEDDLRLLDINILLLAQSEQLGNANRVIEKQLTIGKTLSSTLDMPRVLALILEQMESLIPFSRAAILLIRDENQMDFAASHGYPADVNMDDARTSINQNPTFLKIIDAHQPSAVDDVLLEPEWQHIPGTPPTRSWLGVPLVQNDKALGMLSVSRLNVAPFTPDQVETATIFAGQAAIALGNANLYNEVSKFNQQLEQQQKELQAAVEELNLANVTLGRRAMQLETSNKIGQQITSVLDIKLLFLHVLSIIKSQFNYSWVSVWLVNKNSGMLVLEAGTKTSLALGTTLPLSHKGLAAQAGRTGEIALENNAGQNNLFVPTPGLINVFSEIALPLKFQKDILGVLDIQSERMRAYSPDDIAVLQVTAGQIAIAIRNASLYSELIRLNKGGEHTVS
jgi:GAF domain-containing protein